MFLQNYLLCTKCIHRLCLGMYTLRTVLQVYKVSSIPSHLLTTQCIHSCPSKASKNLAKFVNDITRRGGMQMKITNKNFKTLNERGHLKNSSAMPKPIVNLQTVMNSKEICESVVGTTVPDFRSLRRKCGVASREGDIQGVRSLSECISENYPVEFGQHLSFTYYLAVAEFHAGQYSQALDRMASIMDIPKKSDGSFECEKTYSTMHYPIERKFTRAQKNKLNYLTCLLLMEAPNIDDPLLWDKADNLAQSLCVHLGFDRPAYVIWKAYFFSHLHPALERSDELLARHPAARRLLCEELKDIVQKLLQYPDTEKVLHLLQQLLKYRLTVALPPITSLLLSMHCQNGSSASALETFIFAYKLRIPLTSAVLVQFQQLLHQSRTPMPEELIKLKYSTTKPGATKILPWKF